MFENRNIKQDLFALGLLALVIFLVLAVVSYDRSDPSLSNSAGALVYPSGDQTANLCGLVGAWIADLLLRLSGVGCYYLVISLAVFDFYLLRRKTIDQRWVRFSGWIISLIGFTTLVSLTMTHLFSPLWKGPELGAGGLLGAVGSELLLMHFAALGAYILAMSIFLAGLVMCTDYVVFRLVFSGISNLSRAGRHIVQIMSTSSPTEERKTNNLSKEEETENQKELPVRIRGKNCKPAEEAYVEDEYEEEEYEVEDEYDEEEHPDEDAEQEEVESEEEDDRPALRLPRRSKRKRRLASVLRIKKPATPDERDVMIESLEAASQESSLENYQLPSVDLLLPSDQLEYDIHEKEVRRKAKTLEKTFADFGFNVRVVEIETGPVIAQYEVELEAGLRLAKITNLADDIAIALRVPSVRIVAPIPGKNTVGIEIPNTTRSMVRLREVMEEDHNKWQKMKIPVFLGKDVSGKSTTVDLATLPHLLIAGRTGTGKSVCLNSIITSMVMTRRPDEVKMLMIDPKMVELSPYKKLPHLMHPVVTDMKKAEAILAWAVDKMEERYTLLAKAGVRHVSSYNQLGEQELLDRIQPETDEERDNIPRHLPYVVIIADEMADLMMTAAKEVEGHIIRLAQKSRAVGIHLVLATQKPTVDVITGLIKSNLPARIAFQVASRTDSRVVLDEMGADKLLGNGDMLFLWPGTSTLLRGQGTFLSDDEITKVVDSVATNDPQFVRELVQLQPANAEETAASENKNKDALYDSAVDVVIGEGRGSVSLLQRCLGIGYGRAARLVDFMAEDGIVGPYNGSQAREVLVTAEQWAAMSSGEGDEKELTEAVGLAESATANATDMDHSKYAELRDHDDMIDEDDEDQDIAEYEDDETETAFEEDHEIVEEEAEYDEIDEDDFQDEVAQDEEEDDEWEDEEIEEGELQSDQKADPDTEEAEESDEYEEDEYEEDEWEEDEYEEDEWEEDVDEVEESFEEEKV